MINNQAFFLFTVKNIYTILNINKVLIYQLPSPKKSLKKISNDAI